MGLEISPSLSRLFNLCMRESHYSSFFKIAKFVPVFKGEDPTELSNYRPVSVLPVLSQVFERVLKERLVAFLEREEKCRAWGLHGPQKGIDTVNHEILLAKLEHY